MTENYPSSYAFYLFISVFYGLIRCVLNQQLFDCPLGWETYDTHCYRFVFFPTRSYAEASKRCQLDGAYLVSINTRDENDFVSSWLNRHDPNKANKWITSGQGEERLTKWSGDGTQIMPAPDLWVGNSRLPFTLHDTLVYEYTILADTFKWAKSSQRETHSYICEIALSEAYRIVQRERDHTYGRDTLDLRAIPRGPHFVHHPQTVVVVQDDGQEVEMDDYATTVKHASIECRVVSNPDASYVWYKDFGEWNQTRVDSLTDKRYTVTNGKLLIEHPSEEKDRGTYRCVAKNPIGSVVSEPANINFGFLGEFSNEPIGAVTAKMFRGTVLRCNEPVHHPALSYQWYKTGGPVYFLRFDLNDHMFLSGSGRLYFSEVDPADGGLYHCTVGLIPKAGQVLTTRQKNRKSSLGIQLNIKGGIAFEYGPAIHKDFPTVFPTPSLRGNTLRLECFAFGKLPIYYTWTKDGGEVPHKAYPVSNGMVLVLPNAQLEDSGNYTCQAKRGTNAKSTKTLKLVIEATPFFIFPLHDQHIDADKPFTWRCEAHGLPKPTYTWYKNAVRISPADNDDDIKVQRNILTISKANKIKHEGMYQCEAKNAHGITVTSGQLRIVSFAPSFFKRPVNPLQVASLGGSVTILCEPEASPVAEISWLMDGRNLPTLSDIFSRIVQLKNGNLFIRDLKLSDSGEYTCIATNKHGNASSSGFLHLVEKTIISIAPTDQQVEVNSSTFLPCQASYDSRLHEDLVYVWDIHGIIIDIDNDSHYRRGFRSGVPGFYIINAQLRHTGLYTCTATTVHDKTSHSAHVQVLGPPGECSGVTGSSIGRSASLTWLIGASHGSDVLYFNIEFHTNFNPSWRPLVEDLYYGRVMDGDDEKRCHYHVTGLKPGSSYQFRVVAINSYGPGPPSSPSGYMQMVHSAPVVAVDDVREGSGPVGTLNIEWSELNPEDLTGEGVGYMVYFRMKEMSKNQWSARKLKGRVNKYTALVGARNYFLEYEIVIGVFNSLGPGPNSTIFTIMSSEGIPTGTPTNVVPESVNATAVMVFWDPLPNTREYVRGRIQGYQINYWPVSTENNPDMNSVNIYCDCGEGLVLALDTNDDFWFNVQVFTRAGLGPMSEESFGSTYIFPPQTYPEFVHVSSYHGNSALVQWRGVNIGLLEETLIGYKMRWWQAHSDIRTSNDTIVYDKKTSGVIEGLNPGIVYALRVLGFSAAGDGKKSPTVYFTIEGEVMYNPETTAIMNTATNPQSLEHLYWVATVTTMTMTMTMMMA